MTEDNPKAGRGASHAETLSAPLDAAPPDAAPSPAPDPDDLLASLRIDTSFSEMAAGVRKVLTTVPVRKPSKTEYFRVHPDHFLDVYMIELKVERECYFLRAGPLPELLSEFVSPVRLRLVVTRQGTALLWPIKLPRNDRRADTWGSSAMEAAALAERKWLRIAADMSLGAYQPFVAVADLGDAKWPDEPWPEIIRIALRDRVIDSENHPVVRQLLGQE